MVLKILSNVQTYKDFEETIQKSFGSQDDLELAEKKLQNLRKALRDAEVLKDKLGETLDGLNPLSEDYDLKYEQTSGKLDETYDLIENLEERLQTAADKVKGLKDKTDSSVQVITFMKNIGAMYEEMNDEERKELFQSFIDQIELFPEDSTDGKIIKSISFKFPMAFDGQVINKKKSKDMISFTLDCSGMDIDLSDKGNIVMKKQKDGSQKVIVRKGTYQAIKSYIFDKYEVKVPTLYIAQIKRKYGLEIGKAYNKPEQNKNRVPKCTKEKELLIMEALKFYDLMDQKVEYREEPV